jgi:hypothetical protein
MSLKKFCSHWSFISHRKDPKGQNRWWRHLLEARVHQYRALKLSGRENATFAQWIELKKLVRVCCHKNCVLYIVIEILIYLAEYRPLLLSTKFFLALPHIPLR